VGGGVLRRGLFARELTQVVAGWPLNYWWMAQGGVLLFIALVAGYAFWMNRHPKPTTRRMSRGPDPAAAGDAPPPPDGGLHRGFSCLPGAHGLGRARRPVARLDRADLPVPVGDGLRRHRHLRAHHRPEEFYVAGRRIPPMYNGMATAADWMSAASFISLSGALYLQGFSGTAAQPGGLAYVLGWTGASAWSAC
jgi:cation/acetate symporter